MGGLDVGSAAWFERVETDNTVVKEKDSHAVNDFLVSMTSSDAGHDERGWKLRFTQGYIVLLPMPDFSMPFNVIALSSTAVTFFFGAIFRLTVAGRLPHWATKTDEQVKRSPLVYALKIFVLLLAGAGFFLMQAEIEDVKGLKSVAVLEDFPIIVDYILKVKDYMDY